MLLDKGAHEVLDPLVAAGRATIEEESSVKGLAIADAAPAFQVALDAAGGQADGVLAANDEIADAVIGVLPETGSPARWSSPARDRGPRGCATS